MAKKKLFNTLKEWRKKGIKNGRKGCLVGKFKRKMRMRVVVLLKYNRGHKWESVCL